MLRRPKDSNSDGKNVYPLSYLTSGLSSGLQLQRVGRTGRKRDGYVHVLLSEDREERNWEKADDNYKDVQRFIVKAEHLELFEDVERLIPDHIKPECVEMEMEIEEESDGKRGRFEVIE